MTAEAFEQAFSQLFGVAYRVAYRTLGSASEAEDIAQETLTRALVRWDRVRDHAPAWVATVALRQAIDAGRHRQRHPRAEFIDQQSSIVDWDRRMDLRAALRRLPMRQQQALACRYLADLSDDETARLLDISTGSVKQHAARGLAALRGAVATPEGTTHA